jgi:hypothetical protein
MTGSAQTAIDLDSREALAHSMLGGIRMAG